MKIDFLKNLTFTGKLTNMNDMDKKETEKETDKRE